MARPRKPTALKVVQGTARKDRILNEPDPEVVAPEPPDSLGGEALAEWERITPELVALGLVSVVDRAALTAYCQAWALYMKASDAVDGATSLTFETDNGYMQQIPEVGIMTKAAAMMHKFLTEFGLSPVSRSKINLPERADGENKWSKFRRAT